jgi:hypothetical protein
MPTRKTNSFSRLNVNFDRNDAGSAMCLQCDVSNCLAGRANVPSNRTSSEYVATNSNDCARGVS